MAHRLLSSIFAIQIERQEDKAMKRVYWSDFWAACKLAAEMPEVPARLLARILHGGYSFDDAGIIGDGELNELLAETRGSV